MTTQGDRSDPHGTGELGDRGAGPSSGSPFGNVTLEGQVETLALINAEVSARLDRQASGGSQVDTKAALVAGVAATATQFLASRKPVDRVLATVSYGFYAAAFLAAVAAYALARYQDVPDPRGLVRTSVDQTKAATLALLVATRVTVFEANTKKHRRKVRFWWVSVACLAVGIGLSAAAIVHTGHHA